MSSFFRVAPRSDDATVDNADYAEATALVRNTPVSREDLARAIHLAGAQEQRARTLADDAFEELSNRSVIGARGPSANWYPFQLQDSDILVPRKLKIFAAPSSATVYCYLLAMSRWNMHATHRVLASYDATTLFELLCAEVLLEFWGGRKAPYADAFLVGTSAPGNHRFSDRIASLCNHICEGDGWKPTARSPGAGDGGVDVAVWRRFSDDRPGSLVALAQCKTGIHWRNDLGKLTPRGFCGKFMRSPLILDPLSVYMVPCRIVEDRWEDAARDCAGLLLDRCRIVQYASQVNIPLLGNITSWLRAAVDLAAVGDAP